MNPINRRIFVALALGLFIALDGQGADVVMNPQQAAATQYFECLMRADAEKADALAAAPFSFDRKEILRTKEQIQEMHKKIGADKGARAVPEYKVALSPNAPALDKAVFPDYVAYRITITKKAALPGEPAREDNVDIYVTTGDEPKVIGFSD